MGYAVRLKSPRIRREDLSRVDTEHELTIEGPRLAAGIGAALG